MVGAQRESVGVVRHVLGALADAGAPRARLGRIVLAVSEAVTNSVVHAAPGGTGTIDVGVWTGEGRLRIVVADDGPRALPRHDTTGLGVGLPTIAAVAETVEVVHPPGGGTQVAMAFALGPPRRQSRTLL